MPNDRDSRQPRRRAGRRRSHLVVAAVLFVLVAVYRFNTLGGALGGFDNDHFLHFAYAKQVQAGEQPLRDFMDGGLQGARPSLTYELSAAMQRFAGNDLRSEAWLTVAGVALGAAAAFLAGSGVAPWPLALTTALLSAWLSPKLYGYPKVLVLAGAALLIVRYGSEPGWRRVLWMSIWTAVAFLFRHDYAVYCALGFAVVILLAPGPPLSARMPRVLVYGLLTAVLLGPSLWWIERHAGLGEYLRNGLEMGSRDAQRTDLEWPTPNLAGAGSLSDLLDREENTQAWLYYLFIAAGLAALSVAAVRAIGRRPDARGRVAVLASLGLMTLMVSASFLRGSLEARFGDMAPLVAVIGAALLADALTRRQRRAAPWLVSASAAAAVLLGTAACVWSLQNVRTELLRSGLIVSPAAVVRQASRVSGELAALPAALRAAGASPSMRAAGYLHSCTNDADRVLVATFAPEVVAFSERRFAGGRASVLPGFYADGRYSRSMVARLERESVPIVLAEAEQYYADFPILAEYLRTRYAEHGPIAIDGGHSLRVLALRGVPSRPFGPEGRPCFAGERLPRPDASSVPVVGGSVSQLE